jgi:hypothetical protein
MIVILSFKDYLLHYHAPEAVFLVVSDPCMHELCVTYTGLCIDLYGSRSLIAHSFKGRTWLKIQPQTSLFVAATVILKRENVIRTKLFWTNRSAPFSNTWIFTLVNWRGDFSFLFDLQNNFETGHQDKFNKPFCLCNLHLFHPCPMFIEIG